MRALVPTASVLVCRPEPCAGYGREMTTLVGRGVGGFYLFHHHPWLVVVVLVGLIVGILYLQRKH